MDIETTFTFPPPIHQEFSRGLLCAPWPKYSDRLWKYYQHVKTKLMKRAEYSPQKKKKCLELEQEFLELYEQAKVKEEKSQTAFRNKAEGPFYYPRFSSKGDKRLYWGLR
jgi:hypothetical protein